MDLHRETKLEEELTPLERVLTTLKFKEPDRVPFILPFSIYGAKILNLKIEEYYNDPEKIVKAQIALRERYKHDAYIGFTYSAAQIEALGGSAIFRPKTPPNAGAPIIKNKSDIEKLILPDLNENKVFKKNKMIIKLLKDKAGEDIPVISGLIGPMSLPIMEMSFERYINLIYDEEEIFRELLDFNKRFCLEWANGLFEAGATMLLYFEPMLSPNIFPIDLIKKYGFPSFREVIRELKGPIGLHFASARIQSSIDLYSEIEVPLISMSSFDSLTEIKMKTYGKKSLIGNLNGIEMRKWGYKIAYEKTRETIKEGAFGGGFILSDNHGEIPWMVNDETLRGIRDCVLEYGREIYENRIY